MIDDKKHLGRALERLEGLFKSRRAGTTYSVHPLNRLIHRTGRAFLDAIELEIEQEEEERLIESFRDQVQKHGPQPANPDHVWTMKGANGVVHLAKMLWDERVAACGKGSVGPLRLRPPSAITCRGNGCSCTSLRQS